MKRFGQARKLRPASPFADNGSYLQRDQQWCARYIRTGKGLKPSDKFHQFAESARRELCARKNSRYNHIGPRMTSEKHPFVICLFHFYIMLKKKRAKVYKKAKHNTDRIPSKQDAITSKQISKNAIYLSRAVMAHKDCKYYKPTDYERFNNLYRFQSYRNWRRRAVRNRPCIPPASPAGFPTVPGC